MEYDSWFDTDENKALMAICARKLIRNIGIGGVVWGLFNATAGLVLISASWINAGLIALGLIMLGMGVQALRRPTLGVLLLEIDVTILLFLWNLGMTFYNYHLTGQADPRGLIFPIIIATTFYNYYRKIGHIREQISGVAPAQIKTTKQLCKSLTKKKLKNEPEIIETSNRKCRAQMAGDFALFIQRDLMRAFVAPAKAVSEAMINPGAKSLTLAFSHPLGKLKYKFNRKNSEKIRNWLSTQEAPAVDGSVSSDNYGVSVGG